MGGRGAAGGGGEAGFKKSVGGAGGGAADNTPFEIPSGMSRSALKTMTRKQIENLATAIYANEAMQRGVSKADGVTRARSMMSGNTTTQLIKYISKRAK